MARIINTRIVNLLMLCWNSLLLLVLGLAEILRFIGEKIEIETGVFMITILGFGITGFVHLGKIICFMGQKVDMRTRVDILTIFGLDIRGFIETCQDGRPATPVLWGEFRTSIYVIASSLVVFTQSHLMVGAACTCAAVELLINTFRHLPLKYVFTGLSPLFAFAVLAMLYGYTAYTPVRAYLRRMRS